MVGDAQDRAEAFGAVVGRRLRTGLGVTSGLRFPFLVSVTTAALMTVVSMVGLVRPAVYPADGWESFVTNDAVNLVVGVPALLAVAWWGSGGSPLATLAWPGALGYVAYNYIAYLFGIPVGWLSVPFLALVVLSLCAAAAVLGRVDGPSVRARIAGAVPIRFGGWAVLAFGGVFAVRAATALAGGAQTRQELGVLVADLVVSLTWGVAGVAMIRRRPAGYAVGLGVLALANLLFTGLVVFLLVKPVWTGADLAVDDLLAVAAMWPVTLVPGSLFARGVASRGGRVTRRGR